MISLEKSDWRLMAPDLDERDLKILLLAQEKPITSSELSAALGESASATQRVQVARRFSRLTHAGWLIKTGSTRSAAYHLDEMFAVRAYLDTDLLRRKTKPYRQGWLRDYIPNETRLLPMEVAAQMRDVSDQVIEPGATLGDIVARRLIIDIAWASSYLEGNTYTIGETEQLIEAEIESGRHSPMESAMIVNHAKAARFVLHYAREIAPSAFDIRSIHRMLSAGLLSTPDLEGQVRQQIVEIGRSAYRPESNPHRLQEDLQRLCAVVQKVDDPYEQSFLLMVGISYLQPFVDVNKRTGRVSANIPLLKNGLCPMSYHGMDRDLYINGLLGFYETGSTALLVDAWLDGYQASALRYRHYFEQVVEKKNDAALREHAAIKAAVRVFVQSVADRVLHPDERDDFLRRRLAMDIASFEERDAAVAIARNEIKAIEDGQEVAIDLPSSILEQYIATASACAADAATALRRDMRQQ